MSVKPTLLKEIRKDAVQRHKESTGHGSYNRFELLSPRGRTFSTGKRQLDQGDSTNGSGNASKNPKLDSNAIFAQLEGQEGVISELETLLADMDKVGKDLPQDPRIDNLCKIVKLLAKSHKNITSICVDASKAGNAPAPRAVITVRRPSVTTIRPPPPIISEEEVMTKKVKQALRDAEKKRSSSTPTLGRPPL
jgi:hypothetical protein